MKYLWLKCWILKPFTFFFPSFLIYSQVIIQELRESGAFGSVIQSAQTLSKDKFLSSVESSNVSSVGKQIGVKESQATARRILDINDNFSGGSAMPPLSPPVPEDVSHWNIMRD